MLPTQPGPGSAPRGRCRTGSPSTRPPGSILQPTRGQADATSSATTDTSHVSVGQVAERFGVRKGTIRFYEQLGLLAPHRRGTTHLPPRGPASAGLRAALPGWGAESGGHRPPAGRRRRELARRRPCLVRARLHHVEAELRAVPRGGVEFRMPCDHVLRCRSLILMPPADSGQTAPPRSSPGHRSFGSLAIRGSDRSRPGRWKRQRAPIRGRG